MGSWDDEWGIYSFNSGKLDLNVIVGGVADEIEEHLTKVYILSTMMKSSARTRNWQNIEW